MVKLLGSGGMGVVYQALDRELEEDVALKVLRAPARQVAAGSMAEMQRRFKAELVLARKVTHKNVIRIHDIGETDGIKFISMPLVKGRDLAATLADGPLPIERALRYARQIVSGLMAVHAAGIVHRDLKPSNIMIGNDDQVLLMDFGIARANAPAGQQRTIAGAIVGTTAYMAPEQARGEAVDQRTDVYGFGLIAYEMLCGIRPNLTMAELHARMKAAPPSARQLNPAVSSELDAIIMRCLKPAAADRYKTSMEVGAALTGFKRRKRGPIPEFTMPRWAPRAAAVALVIALLGGLGYWLKTPAATKALAKGQAVVAKSFERLSALNPAALLAREPGVAATAERKQDPVAQSRTMPAPAIREQIRAAAPDARARANETPRAPSVQFPRPASVIPATSRPPVDPVARSPRFDDVRRPERLAASMARPLSPRRQNEEVASPLRTFAPWSPREPAARSPFVASTSGGAVAPDITVAPEDKPAVSRTVRAAAEASRSWVDRVLSGKTYAKAEQYADASDEFQVCHVPGGGAKVRGAEVRR